MSAFQNGILPGTPGAGVTMTLSRVMSSMRHDVAPSRNVSPTRRLEHHLFVELADPRVVGREHAVQAAVGDRAAADDRQHARARARRDRVGGAVPRDARLAARRTRRTGSGPTSMSSTPSKRVVGDLGVRVRAARHRLERRRPAPRRASRRRRWRRSAAPARRAGCAAHAVVSIAPCFMARDRDRADEQVAAVLREDAAAAGHADLVAGAADALQARRHRRRRLDAHDEVDRAHVDAELERRRAHQRRAACRPSARPRSRGVARARSSRGGRARAARRPVR